MGMNRTPLLFPVIYLFLYFSHQSTLWLNVSLNFEMHNLVLCCFFFQRVSSTSHLRICLFFLILSPTSFILCQPSLTLSLFLFSQFTFLPSSLPLSLYTSLISLLSSSLSRLYSFCFSPAVSCLLLLYTHMHTSAHLCACPWQCGGVASLTLNIKEDRRQAWIGIGRVRRETMKFEER